MSSQAAQHYDPSGQISTTAVLKITFFQPNASAPRIHLGFLTITALPYSAVRRRASVRDGSPLPRCGTIPITLFRAAKGTRDSLGGKLSRCEEGFIPRMGISFGGTALLVS
jgi:hypothetical protein